MALKGQSVARVFRARTVDSKPFVNATEITQHITSWSASISL